MSKFLHIVERAYQGTLEEQDDQALWLVGALKKAGLEQSVLLRGPAVAYAVKNQSVDTLHIGGVKSGHPPHLDQDLGKLIEKGIPVYAVREDAQERGIQEAEAILGIQWKERIGVAGLFREADRVLAW